MKKRFVSACLSVPLFFAAVAARGGDGVPEGGEAVDAGAAARAEVFAFLKSCPAFFVATLDGEGGDGEDVPRVRPFGALAHWDGAIYIQTGNFKAVYRQIAAHPRIEICALKPSGSEWVRIAATAVPDTRREALTAVLDANPALRGMYDEDDGKTAVFRLERAVATFNAFGAEPRTLAF